MLPELLPFAKEYAQVRLGTVVHENKAPTPNHHYQQHIYNIAEVQRLLWCPNSLDLNAIEPAWPCMKRHTTRKEGPKPRAEAFVAYDAA